MSNPPPPPVPGGAPAVPPVPTPGIPPVPPVPSMGGAPTPPMPPAPPTGAPVPPAPAAGTAPTVPLRPVAPPLGGGVQLGGGLKTVALTPAAGSTTAQLPKATIALTPTQPLGVAAPVSSMQASFTSHAVDEEAGPDKVMLTLSIIALLVACGLVYFQVTTDRLENRTQPGLTVGDSK